MVLRGLVVALGGMILETCVGVVIRLLLLLLGGIVSTGTLATLLMLVLGVSLILVSIRLLLGHLQRHLLWRRLDRWGLLELMLLAHHRRLLQLHLLHHGGINAGHLLRHILHRLLHHGGIDDGHRTAATYLAHCRHIALHLLPVLCHHLWSHAVVGCGLLLLAPPLWSIAALRAIHVISVADAVAIVEAVTISTITESSTTTVIPFVHLTTASGVSPRLRLLDLDLFAQYRQSGAAQRIFDGRLAIERDESETPWPSGIFIHHEGSIKNATKLQEVFSEVRFRGLLANAADEDLRSLLLLISRDSTLGIDLKLYVSDVISLFAEKAKTHDLAVQIVFLNHHNIDCLRILECQESESTGSARRAVTHDSAFRNFSELAEVLLQGIYR